MRDAADWPHVYAHLDMDVLASGQQSNTGVPVLPLDGYVRVSRVSGREGQGLISPDVRERAILESQRRAGLHAASASRRQAQRPTSCAALRQLLHSCTLRWRGNGLTPSNDDHEGASEPGREPPRDWAWRKLKGVCQPRTRSMVRRRSMSYPTRKTSEDPPTSLGRAADPEAASGSCFPSFLAPRKRSEQALGVCVRGVSTRRVDHLVESLGLRISRSEVSRISAGPDEQVEAFRRRPLEGRYAYLFVDAKVEKVRAGGWVQRKCVVIAQGVHETGRREIVGLDVGEAGNACPRRSPSCSDRCPRSPRCLEAAEEDVLAFLPSRPDTGASCEAPTRSKGSTARSADASSGSSPTTRR